MKSVFLKTAQHIALTSIVFTIGMSGCDSDAPDPDVEDRIAALVAFDEESQEQQGLVGSYDPETNRVWIAASVLDSVLEIAQANGVEAESAVLRIDGDTVPLDLVTGLVVPRQSLTESTQLRACLVDVDGQFYRISDIQQASADDIAATAESFIPTTLFEEMDDI